MANPLPIPPESVLVRQPSEYYEEYRSKISKETKQFSRNSEKVP